MVGTVVAIKGDEGQLCSLQVLNNQAAAAYGQLFDARAADVTPGTTAPDMEVLAPANALSSVPLRGDGVWFQTAISAASTTTGAGSTGSASGVMVFARVQ